MDNLNFQNEKILDIQDAMNRLMNNKEMLSRWLNDFFNSQIVNEIEYCIKNGDFDLIHKSLHHLKGVSANLSLNRLSAIARYLDEIAKSKTNLSEIADGIIVLKDIFIESHEYCKREKYCE